MTTASLIHRDPNLSPPAKHPHRITAAAPELDHLPPRALPQRHPEFRIIVLLGKQRVYERLLVGAVEVAAHFRPGLMFISPCVFTPAF